MAGKSQRQNTTAGKNMKNRNTRGCEPTPGWDVTLTERNVLLVTEAEPLSLASHVCGSDKMDWWSGRAAVLGKRSVGKLQNRVKVMSVSVEWSAQTANTLAYVCWK